MPVTAPDPAEFGWWLASRAAGVVALLCITLSVGVGLAMAGRVSRRPAPAAMLLSVHQHAALAGLVAIAVHGITLLGDRFLSPSIGDIAIAFTSEHEPLWTGLGVTGGWLAAILGPTYWIRNRLPAGLWRRLHRATILVYVLSVAHTLGAGTDAAEPWMRTLLLATGAPILFLFLARVMTPRPKAPPRTEGPRRFRVAGIQPESASVLSFDLVPADGKPVPQYEPGQFVRVAVTLGGGRRESRSYSLSSAPRPSGLRISVKREPGGWVSEHLHTATEVGDVLELSDPAGRFTAGAAAERALVLVSAGVGVTPLVAMLDAVARSRDDRPVWWIHSARNGAEHAFRSETAAYLDRLPGARAHVRYTRPQPRDVLGRDFDATGRLTGADVLALSVPRDAEFRVCGAPGFVAAIRDGLLAGGVMPDRIAAESFGGPPAPSPAGIAAPRDAAVSFSRSGVVAAWGAEFSNLLEVAEASAVPVASGCRVGACHGCRADVVEGSVRHDPEPVEQPPAGSALLCCAVPQGDVVLDV